MSHIETVKTSYGKLKNCRPFEDSPNQRLLVVPGYGESLAHTRKLVDALAGKGFDAFTPNQPRKRGEKSVDPIQRQGAVILELLDTIDDRKNVHVVAHSLGSAAVLKAAQEDPERFASITLMQPVGMVGDQSFSELLGRVNKKVIKNQVGAMRSQDPEDRPAKSGYAAAADTESAMRFSARVARAQATGGGILAKQPGLAIAEANASGKYSIAADIARVVALGITVNIVAAQSDEMFDADKVDAGYQAVADSVSSYSSVADPSARHDTFWMQPERTATMVEQFIRPDIT